MAKNTKGQEEIVGFVAIVVILTVIGLVFLGLTLNSDKPNIKEGKDVNMFLSSALEYTSECEITLNRYLSLQDLIKECYSYSANKCLNGNEVCIELNNTLIGVLDGGYRKVGDDFQIKGYSFRASYSLNSSDNEETKIIGLSKGNCTGNVIVSGNEFFSTYPGLIYVKLSLCY